MANLKEKFQGKCIRLLSHHTISIAALSTYVNRLSGTLVLRPLKTSSLMNHPFYMSYNMQYINYPYLGFQQYNKSVNIIHNYPCTGFQQSTQ